MTIRESIDFNYAGINSADMGISNANLGSGMSEEPFVSERTIREVKIRGNSKRYFQNIGHEPLEFPVSFVFDNLWDSDKIREVARWLCNQTYYQPLYFSANINRIYYALVVDSPNLVHNSLSQGYINLTFRCKDCYSYSPVYTSNIYDLSSNVPEGTIIEFSNEGDVNLKPEIEIEKVGAGDITITNTSNNNEVFSFTGLNNAEVIYVNNEDEIIDTSIIGIYRYSNFNDNYLNLIRGINQLNVVGNCKIIFRYQFKLLQG